MTECAQRGFALQTSVTSWRGTPGTAAGTADVISDLQIVKTGSVITGFDQFGRVTDSLTKVIWPTIITFPTTTFAFTSITPSRRPHLCAC